MDCNKQLKIKNFGLNISKDYHIEPFKYDKDIIEKPLDNKHIKFKEYIDNCDEHKKQ